jgi:aminopeptidase N
MPQATGLLRAVRRLSSVRQVLQQRGPPCWVHARAASSSAAADDAPAEKFRSDYSAPPFTVPAIDLCFILGTGEQPTAVTCTLEVQRSPAAAADATLRLDGEDIVLHSVSVDGRLLARGTDFEVDASCLTILAPAIPASTSFVVETQSSTKPHENFQLSGLYKSSGMFCTQCEAGAWPQPALLSTPQSPATSLLTVRSVPLPRCLTPTSLCAACCRGSRALLEPEGFRRIAYHYDRPDVMSTYKVRSR